MSPAELLADIVPFERMWTVSHLMRMFDVDRSTIERMYKNDGLPAYKLRGPKSRVLFDPAEVRAYIKRNRWPLRKQANANAR